VHARDIVRAWEAFPERHQYSSATVAYLMDEKFISHAYLGSSEWDVRCGGVISAGVLLYTRLVLYRRL